MSGIRASCPQTLDLARSHGFGGIDLDLPVSAMPASLDRLKGSSIHADILKTIPELFRIVSVSELIPERFATSAAELGC